ncbi:hypothetical protein HMPREF2141_02030 [Bacteroides uniformis]|nr:hypothetical protein HMPREF2141_02030 [Bacteroides uniformis]
MFIGAYKVCPKVADVYAKVGDFYPKAWDRQTKGEGNSLSLYLQTLLLVVRKFFIGSREVFCYRFERGIEKNVIFVT